MTERPTMPSLDRDWTEGDWDRFSKFQAWRASTRKRVPLAKVFARLKCGDNVRQRITRLEPCGPLEGEAIRGWHPHHSFRRDWRIDVVMPSDFITKYGSEAYRAIPRSALVRKGHRKAVTREYVQDHFY